MTADRTNAQTALLAALEDIAPLSLSEPWDNTGLLLEPPGFAEVCDDTLLRVLLTIDLTEPVLEEALAWDANVIVAYHPPIFQGFKRLGMRVPRERVVMRLICAGVAVYSPHTALDAAPGGVNDWLADGIGAVVQREAIVPPHTTIVAKGPEQVIGQGRIVELRTATTPQVLADRLKQHLGIHHVRLAQPMGHDRGANTVRRIALCAGAGGSILARVPDADVYVTGEMRHHDVLAYVERGASVIVTDHTHTERGYLAVLAETLRSRLPRTISVMVSERDGDPLEVI